MNIFTLQWLKAIFSLVLRGLNWNEEKDKALVQDLRPVSPAVTETIEASTLRLKICIDGQPPGALPGTWYETPQLHYLYGDL